MTPARDDTGLPADLAWRNQAACIGHEPADFYPVSANPTADGNPERAAALRALAACARCTVRAECLADAVARNDKYGIQGGMTEGERETYRRNMLRRAARAAS